VLVLHMQYWCTVLLLHRPLSVSAIDKILNSGAKLCVSVRMDQDGRSK
jgi:hypothetical protein